MGLGQLGLILLILTVSQDKLKQEKWFNIEKNEFMLIPSVMFRSGYSMP